MSDQRRIRVSSTLPVCFYHLVNAHPFLNNIALAFPAFSVIRLETDRLFLSVINPCRYQLTRSCIIYE
jgi:hypothetical protein